MFIKSCFVFSDTPRRLYVKCIVGLAGGKQTFKSLKEDINVLTDSKPITIWNIENQLHKHHNSKM